MTLLRWKWLPVAIVGAGLVLVVLLLVTSVHASFGDDPLLRLQGFDQERSFLPTSVGCGSAIANLNVPSGTRTLYDVARDGACHTKGVRRFWLALAFGGVMVSAGASVAVVTREEA
ncbi:MAG TPA: hypothetical protein VHS52_03415 [Acidimicrobiales bacterium]|nr:hypothetical protein [Acidimicrobiales bacterium]